MADDLAPIVEEPARPVKRRRWPLAVALVLIAGAGFLAIGDLKKFLAVATDVQPFWLFAAVVATGGAYFFFTVALWFSASMGGFPRKFREILPTSFVSQAVNNLLSSGGVGGLAIRIFGLGQIGIPAGGAAAISAVTTLSNDTVMGAFLLVAIFHLVDEGELSRRALVGVGLLVGVVVVAAIGVIAILKSARLRARVFDVIGRYGARLAAKFTRQGAGGVVAGGFQSDLMGTFKKAYSDPRKLVGPMGAMAIECVFRVFALMASFAAIGHPQPFLVVATGFVIGTSAGALSLIPGGIGVLEGSMAAVYSFLGVELEVAAVAVIVFRLAFYVVPLGVVALFFRPLLKGRNATPPPGEGAVNS